MTGASDPMLSCFKPGSKLKLISSEFNIGREDYEAMEYEYSSSKDAWHGYQDMDIRLLEFENVALVKKGDRSMMQAKMNNSELSMVNPSEKT
ncbi:hypothetical protein BGZ52_010511 [Haplosporangium bisporale]|nr:hypothetical protein BGZ52_010511 [Haplosporangium bisporale]